ncbi:hypothetical protein PsorP6_001773 [Peronosclerospora sorghi]|uniref:Uncharacterized protein n=1 Tax=Peronosclerospora sorghi TaxID=230839 RepID=A0ACC0WTH6_9STRA|nr:hypothetical protein PsorP6_001773 [Peronosclerospora sorghi]
MVAHEDERLRQQKEAQKNVKQKLSAMETAMDARRWELHNLSEKAGAMGNVAVADERTKELVDQLAMKDEQILALQTYLERMQFLTKNQDRKEESYRIMSRCQEIWQEVGLSEEYQANQLHHINELLVQKCSEDLESLEAAREKLQARITTTYYNVQRMEVFLQAGDPVDLPSVPTVAGETLLEQDKYLLALQERLSCELWKHLNARIRTCEGIQEIAISLGIKSIDDFRHVSNEDIGNFDADFFQLKFVELRRLETVSSRKRFCCCT